MKYLIIFLLFFSNTFSVEVQKEEFSFGEQVWEEFKTPVTTNARYILFGSLLSAGMVYINKQGREYNKWETFDDARPFGDYGYIGETLGWGYLNALYMLSHLTYGYINDDQESYKATEHMFKASTYTLFATSALKMFVNERRPGYPEDTDSFPSGHSSMSFAFASVVAARHGWAYGSLAYGLATYISVSRINDDWHYLHDVLVGMGIGASYGWGLKYAYDKELPYQFAVIPADGGGVVVAGYSF